ncbi:MAG: hypothetical protein EBZ96_08925 [Synechococcaceae bacterium WB9_3_282]|nr:hypothetical protein [Synechococcaceae bacterium WB7_1B_046]NDE22962.1 hypothetical protein [Synechococcaceae bacterium WB9_3_282]
MECEKVWGFRALGARQRGTLSIEQLPCKQLLDGGGWPALSLGAAGAARLRSATAVLQRATAVPWRASASRRRPPLRGRWCGGGHRRSPAAAVAW